MLKKLSKLEEKLLRQQAEAYAFISDVRSTAFVSGPSWVIAKTEGVDEVIKQRGLEYPLHFVQYFKAAIERARKDTLEKQLEKINKDAEEKQTKKVKKEKGKTPAKTSSKKKKGEEKKGGRRGQIE